MAKRPVPTGGIATGQGPLATGITNRSVTTVLLSLAAFGRGRRSLSTSHESVVPAVGLRADRLVDATRQEKSEL